MVPATPLVVLLSAILTVLGDVQRPTQGHQFGLGPGSGHDIILPVSIAQCEPVLIYYNLTDDDIALLSTPDDRYDILYLYLPAGVGYFDWICNTPAGYSFLVYSRYHFQYYSVQPGSSSACLGDLTTAYSYASYSTSVFQSYTQQSPSDDPGFSTFNQLPPIDFPTSSFPTITANPNLAVTSTTTSAVSSTSSSPTTSPSLSSHKSNTAIIAGGVVGGIVFVLLIITIIFVFQRKRRNSFSNSLSESTTPYLTSQLRPTSPSPLPSAESVNAMHRSGKFNIRRTATPDTHARNHAPTRKSRNRGADLASTPDVTRLTESQRQALMASLNASTNPTAPPAPADVNRTLTEPLQSSVHEAPQEDFPEIANILGVVPNLSPATRHALVASLNNLRMMDQATSADLTRGYTPSLPPYAE